MAFLLKDEIKLLEREIKISSDKLFIDKLNLKNIKEVLRETLVMQKKNAEFKINMAKNQVGMDMAMEKIIIDKENNLS